VSSGRKKAPGENPSSCIVHFLVTSASSRIPFPWVELSPSSGVTHC
jgi:hypothetical protein